MRNSNPDIVEIFYEGGLWFKCKSCGVRWSPSTNSETHKLFRGSWQCPKGCKP